MEMDSVLGEPGEWPSPPAFGLEDPHPRPLPETKVIETRNEHEGQTVEETYRSPGGTIVRRVVVKYDQDKVVVEREDTGWLDSGTEGSGLSLAAWPTGTASPASPAASPVIWNFILGEPYKLPSTDCCRLGVEDPHPRPLPETKVIETRNEYGGQTAEEIYRDPDVGTVVRRVVVKYDQDKVVMEREDTGWLDSGNQEDTGWLDSGNQEDIDWICPTEDAGEAADGDSEGKHAGGGWSQWWCRWPRPGSRRSVAAGSSRQGLMSVPVGQVASDFSQTSGIREDKVWLTWETSELDQTSGTREDTGWSWRNPELDPELPLAPALKAAPPMMDTDEAGGGERRQRRRSWP